MYEKFELMSIKSNIQFFLFYLVNLCYGKKTRCFLSKVLFFSILTNLLEILQYLCTYFIFYSVYKNTVS